MKEGSFRLRLYNHLSLCCIAFFIQHDDDNNPARMDKRQCSSLTPLSRVRRKESADWHGPANNDVFPG